MNRSIKAISCICLVLFIFSLSAKESVRNGIWDEKSGTWVVLSPKKDKVELFFNNGKKAAEGSIELLSYNSQKGTISFNKKEKWISYYPTGELFLVENYNEKSKLNGEQTSYYKNKKIQRKTFFLNGIPDGRWVLYDDKGTLCSETEFSVGKIIKWNNTKIIDVSLQKPSTVTDGAEWDEKYAQWRFLDESKRILHGWYINGEKASELYVDSERNADGKYKLWHKDGSIWQEGQYIKGEQDGTWLTFSEGKLSSREKYDKGEMIYSEIIGAPKRPQSVPLGAKWDKGLKCWNIVDSKTLVQIIYYESGAKKEEGKVILDLNKGYVENGLRKIWRIDGTLEMSLNYVNGELDGECFTHDENGKPKAKLIYKNGKVIKGEILK